MISLIYANWHSIQDSVGVYGLCLIDIRPILHECDTMVYLHHVSRMGRTGEPYVTGSFAAILAKWATL